MLILVRGGGGGRLEGEQGNIGITAWSYAIQWWELTWGLTLNCRWISSAVNKTVNCQPSFLNRAAFLHSKTGCKTVRPSIPMCAVHRSQFGPRMSAKLQAHSIPILISRYDHIYPGKYCSSREFIYSAWQWKYDRQYRELTSLCWKQPANELEYLQQNTIHVAI